MRAECLDWTLVLGRRHLLRILGAYVRHYNQQRPHRSLALAAPEPQEQSSRPRGFERSGAARCLAASSTSITRLQHDESRFPRPTDTGPNPGCAPEPGGPGNARWSAAPAGLDPATPPGRRPGPARAPAVTGPLAQRRQRPRRPRITPNTTTATTTMISTHNHVDMAASLIGAGAGQADATAGHPSKQLPASRRPPGPGSTAALRVGSRGPLHPARPARRSGLARRMPARPRPCRATAARS